MFTTISKKEKGQGLVEYALILVLTAIVVIVGVTQLGTQVGDVFTSVNSELGSADGGTISLSSATAKCIAAAGPNYGLTYNSDSNTLRCKESPAVGATVLFILEGVVDDDTPPEGP